MHYNIDKYQINHFSDKKSPYRALIMLVNDDNTASALLYFTFRGQPIPKTTISNDGTRSRAYFSEDYFPYIVDFLRNEGPVTCFHAFPSPRPYIRFQVDLEGIGEGEN